MSTRITTHSLNIPKETVEEIKKEKEKFHRRFRVLKDENTKMYCIGYIEEDEFGIRIITRDNSLSGDSIDGIKEVIAEKMKAFEEPPLIVRPQRYIQESIIGEE